MSWDKATNLAMVLACLAVVGDIAYRDLGPGHAAVAARRPPELKPGDAFPSIAGFQQESGKAALLLVVRSSCGFCNQSIPFYQHLVQEAREKHAGLQLVGVCLESSEACAEYFKTNKVGVDVTIGAPTGLPKIAGTPTIVMLDPKGRVKSVWVGALPPDGQQDVLKALFRQA